MQPKTTRRYHFIPSRMALCFFNENNKWRQGCGEIGNLMQCWWECINKMAQPSWKTVWQLLKTTHWFYPKELQANTHICMFIAVLSTRAKGHVENNLMSSKEWMGNKLWYMQTKACYPVVKGNEAHCSMGDHKHIILRKKTQKATFYTLPFMRKIHRDRKQAGGFQGIEGRGMQSACLIGMRFPWGNDENAVELGRSDACITL